MEKYKAKKNEETQEKAEKQNSTAQAVKVAGKIALDAYTGGAISLFANVPILGNKLEKKFDKISNLAAKRINNTMVGKKVDDLATKLEENKMIDTTKNINEGISQNELDKDSLNDEILN